MNFSSQRKQLCIDGFKSSLEGLDNGKRGAGNKSARMIPGALVIKHKMNLSDVDIPNPKLGNSVITGIVQMLQHQATPPSGGWGHSVLLF